MPEIKIIIGNGDGGVLKQDISVFCDELSIIEVAADPLHIYKTIIKQQPDLLLIKTDDFTNCLNLICGCTAVMLFQSSPLPDDEETVFYCRWPYDFVELHRKLEKAIAMGMGKQDQRKKYLNNLGLPLYYFKELDTFHCEMQPIIKRRQELITALKSGEVIAQPIEGYRTTSVIHPAAASLIAGSTDILSSENQTPCSIKMKAMPAKLDYAIGEPVDFYDAVLTVQLDRQFMDVAVTSEMLSTTVFTRPGIHTVKIRYMDLDIPVQVSYSETKLIKLTVSKPGRVQYTEGERFDPEGMVITAYFSDSSSKEVENYWYDDVYLTASMKTMTFHYGYKQCSQIVLVRTRSVQSISIKKLPVSDFTLSSSVDFTGGQLTVMYEGGYSKEIALKNDMILTPLPDKIGTHDVVIAYQGCFTTVSITVQDDVHLSSIIIADLPAKTEYFIGEPLDISGGQIKRIYSDGTEDLISMDEGEIRDYTPVIPGTQTVTIHYNEKQAYFDVTVREPHAIYLEIKAPPKRTRYADGELIDLTGLEVVGHFDNGEVLEIRDYRSTPLRASRNGKDIKVSFDGVTATVPLHVTPAVPVSIQIRKLPDKRKYFLGDPFDPTGGKVRLKLTNGSHKDHPLSTTMVSGFSSSSVGMRTLEISLHSFSCNFEIEVVEPTVTCLEISQHYKKEYYAGESFDYRSSSVFACFDNGRREELQEVLIEPGVLSSGNTSVTLKHAGCTLQIPVIVREDKITSLELLRMPEKLVYQKGESLCLDDGILKATYLSGLQMEIPISNTLIEGNTLVSGTQDVLVSYEGMSMTVSICVITRQLMGIILTDPPSKLQYAAGELFDAGGMRVTAIYDNGDKKEIEEFTYHPDRELTLSDQNIKVVYSGFTAICPIKVEPCSQSVPKKQTLTAQKPSVRPSQNPEAKSRASIWFYPDLSALRDFDNH